MKDLITELKQFTGSLEFYRNPINRKVIYTEGIHHLAENAKAYWLIDDICAAYQLDPSIKNHPFQVWKLAVNKENNSAILSVEDGNREHIKTFDIPYTDFPLSSIILWLIDGTLLLPSEY